MNAAADAYLRRVQYGAPDRLLARARLHSRYGRPDWFSWLAERLQFRPGDAVIDVGCGAGAFWADAQTSLPADLAVRLVDSSAGMVASALKANRAEQGLARWADLQGVVADARRLPFGDGTVSKVMAVHMLYHLDDPARGLNEMRRVCRSGGTVAVVLNPMGSMRQLSDLIDHALDRRSQEHTEPLTAEIGRDLMASSFDTVSVARFSDELVVTDPDDLLAYLLSLPLAETAGAPERLATAVAERFAEQPAFRITKAFDLLVGAV